MVVKKNIKTIYTEVIYSPIYEYVGRDKLTILYKTALKYGEAVEAFGYVRGRKVNSRVIKVSLPTREFFMIQVYGHLLVREKWVAW